MITYSIVIPVFNREDTIYRCISSVLDQRTENLEIIIVNDGSFDNTENILDAFDSSIKKISYKTNMGVNYARNIGIKNASGDYIIFLDSDDYFLEDALLTINKIVLNHPKIKHFLFNVSDRQNDKLLAQKCSLYRYEDWISGKISGDFIHVIKPDCFKERMFFETFRGFESLNWLRVLKYSSPQYFVNINICIRDRHRGDSMTNSTRLNDYHSIKQMMLFLKKYLDLYNEDLKKVSIQNYSKIVLRMCLLAISCDKNSILSTTYFKDLSSLEQFFCRIAIRLKCNKFLFQMIIFKSTINKFINIH